MKRYDREDFIERFRAALGGRVRSDDAAARLAGPPESIDGIFAALDAALDQRYRRLDPPREQFPETRSLTILKEKRSVCFGVLGQSAYVLAEGRRLAEWTDNPAEQDALLAPFDAASLPTIEMDYLSNGVIGSMTPATKAFLDDVVLRQLLPAAHVARQGLQTTEAGRQFLTCTTSIFETFIAAKNALRSWERKQGKPVSSPPMGVDETFQHLFLENLFTVWQELHTVVLDAFPAGQQYAAIRKLNAAFPRVADIVRDVAGQPEVLFDIPASLANEQHRLVVGDERVPNADGSYGITDTLVPGELLTRITAAGLGFSWRRWPTVRNPAQRCTGFPPRIAATNYEDLVYAVRKRWFISQGLAPDTEDGRLSAVRIAGLLGVVGLPEHLLEPRRDAVPWAFPADRADQLNGRRDRGGPVERFAARDRPFFLALPRSGLLHRTRVAAPLAGAWLGDGALVLAPHTAASLDDLATAFTHDPGRTLQHRPFRVRKRECAAETIHHQVTTWESATPNSLFAVLCAQCNELLGQASLTPADAAETEAVLGFSLLSATAVPYAQRLVRMLVAYGRDILRFQQFHTSFAPDNWLANAAYRGTTEYPVAAPWSDRGVQRFDRRNEFLGLGWSATEQVCALSADDAVARTFPSPEYHFSAAHLRWLGVDDEVLRTQPALPSAAADATSYRRANPRPIRHRRHMTPVTTM